MSILSSLKSLFGGGGKKDASQSAPIGEVTHYYDKAGVAVIKFNKKVAVGTSVRIFGATTDFKETLNSMQLDHAPVQEAEAGKEIGVRVSKKAREGDKVFAI